MPHMYILYSKKRNRYYVGSTDDVERRVFEHNQGRTPSTKGGAPWTLVFTHKTITLIQARSLEYKIKSWKDRRFIERVIKDGFLRLG